MDNRPCIKQIKFLADTNHKTILQSYVQEILTFCAYNVQSSFDAGLFCIFIDVTCGLENMGTSNCKHHI